MIVRETGQMMVSSDSNAKKEWCPGIGKGYGGELSKQRTLL